MKGIIVKGIAGFYYVKCEDLVYQCKGRGIFKKDGVLLTVGDEVEIEVLPDGDAVINKLFPRRNIFVRPPISNVDCFVVVMAAADPEPNLRLIDKFIVMAEKSNTHIVVCINKSDLADNDTVSAIANIYSEIYETHCVSAEKGEGITELKKALAGQKCVLSGPSGVGKSTILNALEPHAFAEIGEISEKTRRGKHTTRHVEIFDMEYGGMIFDTPGFTSFDMPEIKEEELGGLYPEFATFQGKCKYDNCRHLREPDCAIRQGVKNKEIKVERYRSYVEQLLEIREREKNKY